MESTRREPIDFADLVLDETNPLQLDHTPPRMVMRSNTIPGATPSKSRHSTYSRSPADDRRIDLLRKSFHKTFEKIKHEKIDAPRVFYPSDS